MKKIIFISFLIVFTSFFKLAVAQENLDSLRKICLDTDQNDGIRIEACFEIAKRLYHSDVDTGIYFTRKALWILNLNNSLKSTYTEREQCFEADAFLLFAEIYLYQGIMDSAIFFSNKAIDIFSKYKTKQKLAQSLMALGTIYDYQARNEDALFNYNKAQKIYEELKDTNGIALVLNNLGVLYHSQGDSSTAIDYLERCIILYQKTGNYEETMWTINNLGNIYLKKNNYKKALELYNQALVIDKKIENKSVLAYTLKNLGNYYLKLKMLDSALYYHQQDLELYTKLKGASGIALANTNIGRVYYEKGDYRLAKYFGETALGITNNLKLAVRSFEVAGLLKDVYRKTSEYQQALYFTDLWFQLRDSMRNADSERASLRQRMQYEFSKKELLAEENHKQELQVASEREQKQKILTYSTGVGLGLVGMFLFFVFNRLRVTRKQKGIIEQQKELVEEKHKEITDSINYAERIQRSFLATKEILDKNLQDYFVFFRPKDVVSGDFYWAGELKNGNFAFSVADSTGHGVPGAIMSILNISSLEKSIEKETVPDAILNETRRIVIDRLKKDGSPEGGKDGMDCSVLVLDPEKTKLTFASANNPVFIVRNKELIEFKADKMPVGRHDKDTVSFILQTADLQKGDVIYTLTDGFPDQFGGEKGKKYMIKNLKNLFLNISSLPMKEQEQILSEEFNAWKGHLEQVDDVCIIGVRI